jgi:hypothetical protein
VVEIKRKSILQRTEDKHSNNCCSRCYQQNYWQEFVVVVVTAAETLLSIRAQRYYYLGFYVYNANAVNL